MIDRNGETAAGGASVVRRAVRRRAPGLWRPLLVAIAGFAGCGVFGVAESIRVMSFNLWHGGDAGKQPLSQTVEVIRAAGADIAGLQETAGFEAGTGAGIPDHGRKVAGLLGWHYFDQGERTGIVSRFPIVANTPHRWGVTIRLPSGRQVQMFNVHFMHAPYQPYQLLKIPYANAPFIQSADEAVREARKARGGQVERLLRELKPALAAGGPVFLT